MNLPTSLDTNPGDTCSTAQSGEIPGAAGGAILLVDDDPAVGAGMAKLLGRHGFEVLLATNGARAMRMLAVHRVGLVITDIFMDQMDGLETISEVRRKHPEIPIVAISGGSPRVPIDCLTLARALGAAEVLSKPISIETMLKVVQRHGHGVTRTATAMMES